ncbi:ImmA/IrrE family metallo-endopeptidase [Mycobacterium timonense]|uniref:ImmA/IrrE family metallo-endopeptidase n=4 Tax=Mycobacterium TaxID=1763 RepID=A0AAW5SCP9_MYCBC|nr:MULTISPECIES: ImmA/IrrE family metallo-endopeptidase [Mycobacterium]MCV6993004.1 ImmA/IrrE family metallo-endopeptidase [Mycobacterium bouchedurhonense]MCV6994663.1 ImmA/IrrE family metallo-endopeptidase [Mycobacterium timonense]ORA42260.1 hypothetical protein BST19_25595 [Mycobacterium bouchedurhonense]CQD02094.1 LtrC-like protein [Mycobacterium europaeum]
MCRATTDPGGPRRCSGDTRAAFSQSAHTVEVLEQAKTVLMAALSDAGHPAAPPSPSEAAPPVPAPAPTPAAPKTVSFADKTTRIEDIRREIDDAIANLNTGEQWQDWLHYASQFHNYSLQNQLLIRMQRPDATFVGGLKKVWNKKFNRNLVAGSKAIWVRAPKIVKKKKDDGTDEEVLIGWLDVPVYDVSDTTGPPLPQRPEVPYTRETGVAPPEMHTELEKQITAHGYTVERVELPENGPEGYTQTTPTKKVVVSTRFSDAHQAMTLAHELAHIQMGHMERHHDYHSGPGGQRPTMEVEAESVAYVIGRHYGLTPGGSAFAYIDGWAKGDTKKVQQTADRVNKACKSILGALPQATPAVIK